MDSIQQFDGVSALSQASISTAGQTGKTLDYDSFLQLLITEMQNQDPTEPMKSSEYVAQLASFSNVEQSVAINSRLDQLLSATGLSQAEAVIGRNLTSADGHTSGVVQSVRLIEGGAIAQLDGGGEIALEPGIQIS